MTAPESVGNILNKSTHFFRLPTLPVQDLEITSREDGGLNSAQQCRDRHGRMRKHRK